MDPLTVIATLCNIVDLAERTVKCVKMAKETYDSASGLSNQYSMLAEFTAEMTNISTDIQKESEDLAKAGPAAPALSSGDSPLKKVAMSCQDICLEITATLEKCRSKRTHSASDSLRTTLRQLLAKSELETLQSRLEKSQQRLQVALALSTSSELRRILALVTDINTRNNELSDMLEDMLERLSDAEEIPRQMQEALQIAKQFQPSRLDIVLRKLSGYGSMWEPNPRYDAVHDASANTFRWILSQPEKLLRVEKHLKMTFPEWLRHGDGVFHVAGKPGAGKSTLMKLICEEKKVRKHLKEWAGSSRLIFAQYFFWKPDSLQNGFRGLKRCLLQTIVKQVPELCGILFPQLETQAAESLSTNTPKFSNKEVSESLEAFWDYVQDSDSIRICIVIDGLNEFQEGANDHRDLVNAIQNWTHKASRRAKFCVSSREYDAFSVFPDDKRIRLHNLTEEDIQSFIIDRLWTHPRFPKVKCLPQVLKERPSCCKHGTPHFWEVKCPKDNTGECEAYDLLRIITRKAEGVFLWVDLLLRDLRKCLDRGLSLFHLRDRVYHMPEDLEAFFGHLFETIHPGSRRESYILLALASVCNQVSDMPKWLLNVRTASLLYSNGLVGLPPTSIEPFFHINLMRNEKVTYLRPEQLSGLCNGLISLNRRLGLIFTHRSVFEFLQKHLSARLEEHGITKQLLGIIACRIQICDALFRFEDPMHREYGKGMDDEVSYMTSNYGSMYVKLQVLLVLLESMGLSKDPYIFEYLSIMDNISSELWHLTDNKQPHSPPLVYNGCGCRLDLDFYGHAVLRNITQIVTQWEDLSYIIWSFANGKISMHKRISYQLLYSLLHSKSPDAPTVMRFLFRESFCVLDGADREKSLLIDRRQPQDQQTPSWHMDHWDVASAYELWHRCLTCLIRGNRYGQTYFSRTGSFTDDPFKCWVSNSRNWEVVECWMERGVDTRYKLVPVVGNDHLKHGSPLFYRTYVRNHGYWVPLIHFSFGPEDAMQLPSEKELCQEVSDYMRKQPGKHLTLRGIIELIRPKNVARLLELVDRNDAMHWAEEEADNRAAFEELPSPTILDHEDFTPIQHSLIRVFLAHNWLTFRRIWYCAESGSMKTISILMGAAFSLAITACLIQIQGLGFGQSVKSES